MALPMQSVADSIADMMNDPDHVRWPIAELIRWANESMGAILSRRPAAFTRRSVIALVAGSYQTIPADGSILLDVVRNIAANGTTSGKPIRRTDRQLLDDSDPNWQTGTQKSEVKRYTFDDRAPKMFYVYPPAVAGTKVELLDSALPADISAIGESLDIGAEYKEAVINYVGYRCNTKDSEFANGAIAAGFYQAFEASLGIKNQSQAAASPNQPGTSV